MSVVIDVLSILGCYLAIIGFHLLAAKSSDIFDAVDDYVIDPVYRWINRNNPVFQAKQREIRAKYHLDP